jgi:hypothetical protein
MLKRVLIISPHFPPVNAPDHQRVRMALSYFEEFGWRATVLAVQPEAVEGGLRDQKSEDGLPEGTRVIRTQAISYQKTRRFGLGSLAIRAYPYLRRAGDDLLKREKFDAVFFSTTQFPVMALGRRWLKKFKVPYVLDFQDPWRNDYYERTGTRPPGGKFKYAFSQLQARVLEPYSVRRAAHIICVSSAYVSMLQARYPWLGERESLITHHSSLDSLFTVLPFGAAESDFEFLERSPVKQTVFNPADGKRHWVYVGACGPMMAFALRAFFTALKSAIQLQPALANGLRLHFVGTDYAPAGRTKKTVEPIAIECGVGELVSEQPARLPYFEALQCLLDADALIVPGSDDPGYTASKIYPYILAKKPLLAIFHEQSSVVDVLNKTKAGTVVAFKSGETPASVAQRILQSSWFPSVNSDLRPLTSDLCVASPATDWSAFAPYTAREMTRKLCEVFDQVAND